MWGWIITSLRKLLLLVFALVGLLFALWLAWLASNNRWVDAKPQAWPAALAAPANTLAPAENLLQLLEAVPLGPQALTLPDCEVADCAALWRSKMAEWAERRGQQAAMGAVCERATAGQARPQFQEPMPERWTGNTDFGSVSPLSRCSTWLLIQAFEASEAGDAGAALAKLRQAQGLHRALLAGARSLLWHSVGLGLLERELRMIAVLAVRHPAALAELQALAGLGSAELAAAQRRWVPAEASFQRGVNREMAGCADQQVPDGRQRWLCHLMTLGMMPEYAEQLIAADWLGVLDAIRDDDPLAALRYLEARDTAAATGGLFGSAWHWRGTTTHILFAVGRPAFQGYFARAAQLALAAQATQLWLQARAEAIPPERRAAWLAQRVHGTLLAERLSLGADGSWQLQSLSAAGERAKAPTRWPL